MAFPTGWGRRCALVIQASLVASALTGFPLLLTEANLPSEMFDADGSYPALSGGGDIRFSTDAAGSNQLACEVVYFTTDNDPANGRAEIWVIVPSVSASVDTEIYVWWNKTGESQPAVADTYGRNAVWSDYEAVYHLYDLTDSTGNGNDLTASGSAIHRTSGSIVSDSGDYDLDDTDYFLSATGLTLPDFSAQAFTMQSWVQRKGGFGPYFAYGLTIGSTSTYLNNTQQRLHRNSSDIWFGGTTRNVNVAFDYVQTAYTDSEKFLHAIGTDGADGELYVREWDEGSSTIANKTGFYHNGTVNAIGVNREVDQSQASGTPNAYFDELRLTSPGFQRSLDWLDAEFANVVTPSSFLVPGTPGAPGGSGPTYSATVSAALRLAGFAAGIRASAGSASVAQRLDGVATAAKATAASPAASFALDGAATARKSAAGSVAAGVRFGSAAAGAKTALHSLATTLRLEGTAAAVKGGFKAATAAVSAALRFGLAGTGTKAAAGAAAAGLGLDGAGQARKVAKGASTAPLGLLGAATAVKAAAAGTVAAGLRLVVVPQQVVLG